MLIEQEYVARGAAWLDEVKPDWFDIVDLAKLNISSSYACVAGQVFAGDGDCCGYCYAYRQLELAGLTPGAHGFSGDGNVLQGIWITAITERRNRVTA
jgi:hypothetical protein